MKFVALPVAVSVLFPIGGALAAQFTYSLTGTFNDQGTVTGTVTFDTAQSIPTVTKADFTTTKGKTLHGNEYGGAITPFHDSKHHAYHYVWSYVDCCEFDISFKKSGITAIQTGNSIAQLKTLGLKKQIRQEALTSAECNDCGKVRRLKSGTFLTLVSTSLKDDMKSEPCVNSAGGAQ